MYSARRLGIFIVLGLSCGLFQMVSAEPGESEASFLKVGVGAKALGMGGAFVGLADDASALYWNPGGLSQLRQKEDLSQLRQREVLFAHNVLSQGISQYFLGYVQSLGERNRRNIGLALNYMNVGDIEGREGEFSSVKDLEASFSVISLNYSQCVGSDLGIGVSGKVIAGDLEGDQETAFALDLGLLYLRGSLGLGVSLNNLGSQLGGADLPKEIRAGLSYRLLKDKLTLVASLDTLEETRWHLGAQCLLFDKFVALRGGFETASGRSKLGSGTGLSLGLGLNFNNFRLDYAFLPYGEIGDTHRLSLAVNFKKPSKFKCRPRRIVVLHFVNETGKAEFDWLMKSIPNLLTTELANSNCLIVVDPDRVKELINKGLNESEIARETRSDILIKGSFTRSGKTFRIDARAIDAQNLTVLVGCSEEESVNKLFRLVFKLAQQLDRKLFFKLNPEAENISYKPLPGAGLEEGTEPPDLGIEDIEIGNIFPSRYNYYTENPIGRIILRNNSGVSFDNVKVWINMPGFMSLPDEIRIGKIPANQSKEVLLKVALDKARLLKIDENTPAPAEIKVIYYKKGQEEEIAFKKPIVLFDRNAIDWENPASIAAFITPEDEVIDTFSSGVLDSIQIEKAALPGKMFHAAALFEALSLYCPSISTTSFRGEVFDYAQYPAETLELKSGDGDDFAVLYASLLENIGIRTKLVNPADHIFLLLDSGLTKKDSASFKEEYFVLIGDRLFIPVEMAKLGGSFMNAWFSGVEEYARWQLAPDEMSLIDLPSAWKTYPSIELPVKPGKVEIPEAASLLVRVKEDDKQFKLKVVKDVTPPGIVILEPLQSISQIVTVETESVRIIGLAADESGVKAVYINDDKADSTTASPGEIKEAGLTGEVVKFTGEVLLALGENEIEITAVDIKGNTGAQIAKLLRKDTTPPEIAFIEPFQFQTPRRIMPSIEEECVESVTIIGLAADESGVNAVYINDDEANSTAASAKEIETAGFTGKKVVKKFTREVPLAPGENKIKITVVDIQGNTDSREVSVRCPGNKPDLWVLAIGVSKYQNPNQNLQYADYDAQRIAEVFSQQSGNLFNQVHSRILTNERVTRENVFNHMGEFLKQTSDNDVVLIFLAGHGVRDRQSGSYYFLTYDSTPDNLISHGLRMSDLDESLKILGKKVGKRILFLDTCHAGAMRVAMRRAIPGEDLAEALREAEETFILSSSRAGEESQESSNFRLPEEPEGRGHGAFTYAILKALAGEGDSNRDGNITILELLYFVATLVPQITGNAQHPYQRIQGTDMPIYQIGNFR